MTHIVQLNVDIPLLCRLNNHVSGESGVASLIAETLDAAIQNIRRDGFSFARGMRLQTHASGSGEDVGWIEDADQVWTGVNPRHFTVQIDLSSTVTSRQQSLDKILRGLSDHFKSYDKGATSASWKIRNNIGHVVLVVPASALNCLREKPLKLFEISVSRTVLQTQVMTIEAEDAEQARNRILNQPAHHFEWRVKEADASKPVITALKDLLEEESGTTDVATAETPKG
jgi:hypothetical protein